MIERLYVVPEQLPQRLEVWWRHFPRYLPLPSSCVSEGGGTCRCGSGGGGGICHVGGGGGGGDGGGGGGGGSGFTWHGRAFTAFSHGMEVVFGQEGLGFWGKKESWQSKWFKSGWVCGGGHVAVLDPELRWMRIRGGLAMLTF